MATIPQVAVAAPQERRPVAHQGQWRGFADLVRNELRRWWGTRCWLVHLLVWIGGRGPVTASTLGLLFAGFALSTYLPVRAQR